MGSEVSRTKLPLERMVPMCVAQVSKVLTFCLPVLSCLTMCLTCTWVWVCMCVAQVFVHPCECLCPCLCVSHVPVCRRVSLYVVPKSTHVPESVAAKMQTGPGGQLGMLSPEASAHSVRS